MSGESAPIANRAIGRNLVWLMVERAGVTAVGVTVSVALVRYLGPEDFGSYSFALAFVGIAVAVVQLPAPLIVRQLVVDEEEQPETLAAAARITAALAVVAIAVVGVGVVASTGDGTVRTAAVIAALGLLLQPVLVLDFLFQSRLQARNGSRARLGGIVASAIGVGAVIGLDGGIVALAAATLLNPLTTGLLYAYFYRRGGGRRLPRPSSTAIRALARRGLPLVMASMAIAIYMRIDQLMLGLLSDRRGVGLYAATVRLSEFAYFLPVIFMSSVGPGIARAKEQDEAVYRAAIERMFSYLSATALMLIVLVQIVGEPVAVLLFGEDFRPVGDLLSVHILALIFVFLSVGEAVWTSNEGLERLAMYRTFSGVVVNVGLNAVLIPAFGAMGAAWATVAAYSVASVLGDLAHPRTRDVARLQLRSLLPSAWVRAVREDLSGSRRG